MDIEEVETSTVKLVQCFPVQVLAVLFLFHLRQTHYLANVKKNMQVFFFFFEMLWLFCGFILGNISSGNLMKIH